MCMYVDCGDIEDMLNVDEYNVHYLSDMNNVDIVDDIEYDYEDMWLDPSPYLFVYWLVINLM